MKKLLLISDNYPFGINESTFILPELPALAGRFEVVVASCNCVDEQTAVVPEGIKVIRVKMNNTTQKITGRIRALADPAFYRECARIFRSGEKIANRLAWSHSYYAAGENFAVDLHRQLKAMNWQPDIIYSYWHMTPLYGVLRRRKWFGSPAVVARAHGRDIYEYRNRYGWQSFKPEADKLLDGVFLACRAAYDYYGSHFSVTEGKMHVAVLGADGEGKVEIIPDETLRLFSCSNVIPLKRVGLIVEALSIINDIKVSWTHVGDGDQMEYVQRLAAEKLDSKPNISYEFPGRLPNNAVRELLGSGRFDHFITVTETEGGVPVSIVEAYTFGIPAIATDVGGVPEIVDNDNGFLLSENPAAQEIADAVRRAAALSDEERRIMRDNAYNKWQSEFVAKDNAQRFALKLEEILNAKQKNA